MSTIKLRKYQEDLNSSVRDAWANAASNVMMVLPTGGGKTVSLSALVSDQPSCVIAHRQELVSQISLALAKNGIVHRIIGSQKVIKMIVGMHMNEFGRSFYDHTGKTAVAGVDTLIRRGEELRAWLPTVRLWVIDECFPAGTLVDGRPIETLKIGDYVTSFDEINDTFHSRKVTHIFKNKQPQHMMTLETESHHVLDCTLNHPFWTKRGWISGFNLTTNDEILINETATVSHMRETRADNTQHKTNRSSLLFKRVFKRLQSQMFIDNHGENKSKVRQCANEKKQPYAKRRNQEEGLRNIEENRPQTENSRRQWQRSNQCRKSVNPLVKALRFQASTNSSNRRSGKSHRFTTSLQNRLWSQGGKDRYRGGWFKPLITKGGRCGSSKRPVSHWSRVASVQIFKPTDRTGYGDGYVYNIEVDEFHTYTANNITVHNCHHNLKENKWGKACAMFPNARGLGVTATPLRADGQGLGRDNDGLFDTMVTGPSMRELINQGYLTEYRIFAPVTQDLNLDAVKVTATGDYSKKALSEAVANSGLVTHEKSTMVGDVVSHYKKIASGKLGVTFVPDMETGREIESQFNAVGIRAILVNAKTPCNERAKILKQFANHEYMQLINVDLFGEGFDLPAIEVISMARPTASYGLYVQMFGRVLRIMEGKEYGLIIDHVGNVAKHGLPDAPREWSLDRRTKRGESAPSLVKACPACSFVFERYKKECPDCGHSPAPMPRATIQYVDGDLTELDAHTLATMRGEVNRVNKPVDQQVEDYRQQLQNKGAKDQWVQAHCRRKARELNDQKGEQKLLRDEMAQWAGYRRAEGHDDGEIFRLFYIHFGIDWLSAQALSAKEAEALRGRL